MDETELNKAMTREVTSADGKQNVEREAARPFAKEALANCEVDLPGVLKKAVDVYDGPKGKGYVVRMIYEHNGERWWRCESRGPQSFRNTSWKKMIQLR